MSKRTVVLIITDGWGIGRDDPTNPVYVAKPKTINYIKANYLSGVLQASGIAVGLPWNEEGNSEVGHLTIGAGKVIYQHYPRITIAIEDKSFFDNKILTAAFNHAIKNKSAVNLVGILSEGNIHASSKHLVALIEFAKKKKVPLVKLHIFADSKDSPPKGFLDLLNKLDKQIGKSSTVKLASLSGRYFSMDRDHHWDRTKEAYDALLGKKELTKDLEGYIKHQYDRGLKDDFIAPVCLGKELNPIKDKETVIFFNYREDSIRQIAAPFVQKDFKEFNIISLKNLHLVTMTNYSEQFDANVAFPAEKIDNSLGKVLADNDKLQLRVAETEKYAHVTYFFNGFRDKPFKNEFRILIPSRNIAHHDDHPEMMASEISNRIIQSIEEREMDFIVGNFASPDIIAHTGNFDAAVKALKVVDDQIDKIMRAALAHDAILIITADHGNVERMINPMTGKVETKHDTSPVPFYLIGKEFKKIKTPAAVKRIENETIGMLSDISPTILDLMKIKKPPEMTGQSLVNQLK